MGLRFHADRGWNVQRAGEVIDHRIEVGSRSVVKVRRSCGETAQEKFELLRWLFWDNHKLTGYMATYRYFRTFTPSPDEHVLKHFRRRIDDFLSILEQHMQKNAFAIGERPTVADISMIAYLHYPADETGYDLATSHPAINAWLKRMAQLPGWKSAYDLLPGKRLTHYAK